MGGRSPTAGVEAAPAVPTAVGAIRSMSSALRGALSTTDTGPASASGASGEATRMWVSPPRGDIPPWPLIPGVGGGGSEGTKLTATASFTERGANCVSASLQAPFPNMTAEPSMPD